MRHFDQLLDGERSVALDRCKDIVLSLLYWRIIVLENERLDRKLIQAIIECDHYINFVKHPKVLESDIQLCITELAETLAMDDEY